MFFLTGFSCAGLDPRVVGRVAAKFPALERRVARVLPRDPVGVEASLGFPSRVTIEECT